MLSATLGVLAVIVLTAATGYFVAQEFAYVAADRATLEQAAARGDTSARRAVKVIGRLSFMLSGAQLGITMTTLVVGFIAKPALAELIRPLLDVLGVPEGATGAIALATGFVLATLIQMLLGELFPKNLALARAEALARALAASTLFYLTVAGPVIRLFDRSAERLLRAVGVEPVEELHGGATLEELGDIIGKSRGSGHLPADLSGLLERAVSFGDLRADEVMVPRPQVRTLPGTAPVADLVALIRETGHSAYPVYGQEVDDVVGVAGVREVADDALDPATPIRAVARPALFVPGSQPLYGVIERMRDSGEEFACVVDEYGGLAGILTFEDVAEELVGEIADETDEREDAPTSGPDGSWLVDAGMRIDEVARLTGLDLPDDGPYDTLGGLVMAELRRLPSAGDRLTVEPEDGPPVELEVVSVARRVAEKIRIIRTVHPEAHDQPEETQPKTTQQSDQAQRTQQAGMAEQSEQARWAEQAGMTERAGMAEQTWIGERGEMAERDGQPGMAEQTGIVEQAEQPGMAERGGDAGTPKRAGETGDQAGAAERNGAGEEITHVEVVEVYDQAGESASPGGSGESEEASWTS